MSEDKRVPGEITELAEPVVSKKGREESGEAGDLSQASGQPPRAPGLVNEDAEALGNDVIAENDSESASEGRIKKAPWRFFVCAFSVLFLSWVAYDFSTYLISVYDANKWAGIFLLGLTSLFLFSCLWIVLYEAKAWKNFDAVTHRKEIINRAITENDLVGVKAALSETLQNLKETNPALISQFEDASFINETPAEYLNQLENIVLIQLDKQVDSIIKNTSVAAGVSVAVIPHPALDALAVTWYGLVLSKRVAVLYGMKPSGISTLRVFKYILTNAVFAATAEVATEALADGLTDGAAEASGEIVFGSVFSKIGQGAITVWRIYRLGGLVKSTFRPGAN